MLASARLDVSRSREKRVESVAARKDKLQINLALQGGGAHGAFTWGVIDHLLEATDIDIGWISGTSAGAVNAVATASGLATGGRDGARQTLNDTWEAVHQAGVPDLLRFNPFLVGVSRAMGPITGVLSPYDFNPLGFDPLRRLLEKTIDFAALRGGPTELIIAATALATGRARLFHRPEITIEAVLASCCLPTLHHAVEIDGAAYWDGGFSANPELVALAHESPVSDTLIVQLTPLAFSGTPRGAREITSQVNRLTFNAPLIAQVEQILAVRACSTPPSGWWRQRRAPQSRLASHRFHLIEATPYISHLPDDSKIKPDLAVLMHLANAGRREAAKWIERHRAHIGRQETVDLRAHFLESPAASAADVPPLPAASTG
jgi:NTE family protein